MNKVYLYGKLGKDVELRYTQSQTPVANFSLATTSYVKQEQKTEWHKIVAWGKTAENANAYLRKGSGCIVEGRIETRSWDGKDGQKCYSTEIIADKITFTDSRNSDQSNRFPPNEPLQGLSF